MTTIVINKNSKGQYLGFTCFGHADYARKGKPDIVCSAITVLVKNTVNSMESLAGEKLRVAANEETGFLQCDLEGVPSDKSVLLLDSMLLGLTAISREYGEKYLKVNFEEV